MWDGVASREGNLLARLAGYEEMEALTRLVGGVTDLYATLTGREKDLLAVLMGWHPVFLLARLVVVVVMVVDKGSNLLARLVGCEIDLTGKWAACDAAFFGRLADCDDLFGRLVGCDEDLFTM